MDDILNLVYVRFDKNLDYKSIVNSFAIKRFCESVYGDMPKFISPTKFTFDRDRLGLRIQDEYNKSIDYIIDIKKLPVKIIEDYYDELQETEVGEDLTMVEFEPNILLDDHIITINRGDRVLGVIATEFDFENLIC